MCEIKKVVNKDLLASHPKTLLNHDFCTYWQQYTM